MAQSKILLGRIAGAHGIKGDVVVHSYAAVAQDIAAYGPLSSKDGARSFKLSVVRVTPKGVIARIAGITDRNEAEALKGTELYVARDLLPPPENDAYYVTDLVGMAAVDAAGALLGTIVDVPNYGAGDLLEIRKPGSAQTDLVPFTDAYVPEVDLAGRRVVVRPLVYLPDDEEGPAGTETEES